MVRRRIYEFQPDSDTLMSSNEPRGRGSHREASAENDEPYVPQIFLQCARTYASSTASAALVRSTVAAARAALRICGMRNALLPCGRCAEGRVRCGVRSYPTG